MTSLHPPTWFTSATATAARTTEVDVEGCRIHALSWGDTAKPGLMLVHGGAAHAHWWDFIAPQLTHHYHVAAIDLSGHGDSGHRDAYAMEQWAREVLHVAGELGMDRPITVGHSMGGFVTMLTAALHGDDIAGTAPARPTHPLSAKDASSRQVRRRGP